MGDCEGTPNGDAQEDGCGVCGGHGESCGLYDAEQHAKDVCVAMGWTVNEVSANGGAIVCTSPGTSSGANCNTCDTWRLMVFVDGGQDQSPGGEAYDTVAGSYYSGHTPCSSGNNLDYCGVWGFPVDCAGTVNGDAEEDQCGECGGNGSSCGLSYETAAYENCEAMG